MRTSTGDKRRLSTNPSGLQTETLTGTNGSRTTTSPNGTVSSTQEGPDPRWGMQSPISKNMTVTTPNGLTFAQTADRTVTLTNPKDLLSLITQTDTVRINNRAYTSVFDASTNQITATSPVGRQANSTIDAQGRVLQEQVTGLDPANFTYDTRGRLTTTTQGT